MKPKILNQESLMDKFNIINGNNITINQLKKDSQIHLMEILKNFLYTGTEILENFNIDDFKEYTFSGTRIIIGHFNYFNYCRDNPNTLFYLGKNKNIVEINFRDSLDVYKEIELKAFDENQYVIELIFKSKRMKLRKTKIVRNKFRFTYSKFKNEISLRVMNE